MAAPSSFLIGGAPQQNFDYMAVANQRVRTINAMVHTLGSVAKIGQDMYVSKVNKQLTEYTQLYEADLIKWKSETAGLYRTQAERLDNFNAFSADKANKYKLAIGDEKAQQLFDENTFSVTLEYQTDAGLEGEQYYQQDKQVGNKSRVLQEAQNIANADKDKIYNTYARGISLLMQDADVQFENKEISKSNYDGYVSDIKGLTRVTIQELIKKDPVNALEFVEAHKDDLDQSSYLNLRERAMEARGYALSSNFKSTQAAIDARIEEANNNGTSGLFKDQNMIAQSVALIEQQHKGDPFLIQRDKEKLLNAFVNHDLAKQAETMSTFDLRGKLLDIQSDQSIKGAVKDSRLGVISKEMEIRENQPIIAALRAPHVQQLQDGMQSVQDRYTSQYGQMSNWPEKAREGFTNAARDYTQALYEEQIKLGVSENNIQVFNDKTVAIYQNQLSSGRLEPTQILSMLNEIASITGSAETFAVGISQIEKGDDKGILNLASMFLSWDETKNDIYPINEAALIYTASVSTMDWPDRYTNTFSPDDKKIHKEDIAASLSSFLNTVPEESRDGIVNIASKAYALKYAETMDEEVSLKHVQDKFINSSFITTSDGGRTSEMLVPNKYLVKYDSSSHLVATKPHVIEATTAILNQLTPNDVDTTALLADIQSEYNMILDTDAANYDTETSGMINRSRWAVEDNKLVCKITNRLGERTEKLKLVNKKPVEISLEKAHELYNLAYAEVAGSTVAKVAEYNTTVVDKYREKLMEHFGLDYTTASERGNNVTFKQLGY